MNKLHIIGNLVRDPESRVVSGDIHVTQFTVAVNDRRNKEKTDFFRVTAWRGLGDNCQKWLVKGRKVAVTGSVSLNTYTKADGTNGASMEVTAEDVEFLSPVGERAEEAPKEEKKEQKGSWIEVTDEELPF